MNDSRIWWLRGVLILLFVIAGMYPMKEAMALVQVSSYEELKQVLGQTGSEKVELQKDFSIEGPVVIRGDKVIDGQGHCMERSRKKDQVYGGSLFLMQGESCVLRNVSISGAGKSKYVVGKVFGRLLEVRQGTVFLEDQCVLRDNVNDRLAVDGGGALLIGKGGSCNIRSAVIQDNQNVSRGAGICVKSGGSLTVKGGVIRNNKTVGAGAVEGFDGRGGAIYNEGKVTIQGGSIQDNRARPYREGAVDYGGVGAAIYTEDKASLCVRGGTFSGNLDGRGCPIWIRGSLMLGGTAVLEHIYLEKGVVLQAENTLQSPKKIVLQPAVYEKGLCVAKGKKAPFVLAPENGYELVRRNGGYYLKKKSKNKKTTSPTKKNRRRPKTQAKPEKDMKQTAKKNRETKRNIPMIYCEKSYLIFYVGEKVEREVLLYGVQAKDSQEGDITENIKIRKPLGEALDTNRVQTGEIVYEVENCQGVKAKKKVAYRIKQNQAPEVKTAPRFLFAWEVEGYTDQQWKQLLLQGCRLVDDCERQQDLEVDTAVEQSKIQGFSKGYREIALRVQDQFGHRYYMKKGERRRYGKGKMTIVKIPVTLVDLSDLGTGEEAGYLRFVEPHEEEDLEEWWYFSAEELQRIQEFMETREDPFARETNQEFMKRFQKCRRYEEDVGYE